MNFSELITKVEDTVRNIVRRSCPHSWDEDHITFCITDELGALPRTEITGLHRPFHVTWDARKLRGPAETALGDLGILVRITSWDGDVLEGIGLLEAKIRPLKANNFPEARVSQLKKINKNAPRSRLLLYDHTDITEFGDNLQMATLGVRPRNLADIFLSHDDGGLPFTQATAVPINLALSSNAYNTSLYKYSLPFSVQLCSRYFRGLDLEFESQAVEQAKGYIERSGGPRHLLLVGIGPTVEQAVLPHGVNSNMYGPMRDQRRNQ